MRDKVEVILCESSDLLVADCGSAQPRDVPTFDLRDGRIHAIAAAPARAVAVAAPAPAARTDSAGAGDSPLPSAAAAGDVATCSLPPAACRAVPQQPPALESPAAH